MKTTIHRGVMLDLARERTFHLDWTLELLRDLPRCGTNELHLYLENRFAFPSLPGSYPPGSLTPGEARRLQEEGDRIGVQIVPQINVLGHNENVLRRVRFQDLRSEPRPQDAYQLHPRRKDAREILAKQIRDITATFRSELVIVCADETHSLPALARRFHLEPWELYLEHVLWVRHELQRHGRRMGLAGDMLLHYPPLLRRIPKDVTITDWCYEGSRPASLRQFQQHGFETIATTSPLGCISFLPEPNSVKNQLLFLQDARRAGVPHHLSTCWEIMHGCEFSLMYAFSIPAQLAAAGRRDEFFHIVDRRWWQAAEKLSRLQELEDLLVDPTTAPRTVTRLASFYLGYSTHPFSFLLQYAPYFGWRKLERRHAAVRQWQRRARGLPAWKTTGPLRYFRSDLVFVGRILDTTLQRLLDWRELKRAFEQGRPRQVQRILDRWQREYEWLMEAFQKHEMREGYGRATRRRISEALSYLRLWQPRILKETSARSSHCTFEIFIESLTPSDAPPLGYDRKVHPIDLL